MSETIKVPMNSVKVVAQQNRVFETLAFSNKLTTEAYDIHNKYENRSKVDDLYTHFRGLLILGRILGVMPISGVFGKSHEGLQYRFLSFPSLTSFLCLALLAFNCSLAILKSIRQDKKTILDLAKSIGNPLFCTWGCFIYAYFMYKRHSFINIFKKWHKYNQDLVFTKKDVKLNRTLIVICVVMFSSAILENAVLQLEYFKYFDDINGHTKRWGTDHSDAGILKTYYWRGYDYWYQAIGYHPILAVMVFVTHKFVLYGWNYSDIFSGLFFRALNFKFKALCETAEELLVRRVPLEKSDTYINSEEDKQAWVKLAKDHESLCKILNAVNDFFSPLLFTSYAVNIYFFCMQLLFGLNPEEVQHSIVHSIYAPWSFIHVILRIFSFTYFAAQVNEYAHKIRDILMRCPAELYSGPVAKLEKLVNSCQKLGVDLLGCLVISRGFMLSILNVVFTVEIVLLQGLGQSSSQNETC